MNRTTEGTFHIHTDARERNEQFETWCDDNGLATANFDGHPAGYEHFEPVDHRTLKLGDRSSFDAWLERICEAAERFGFVGYIEGEAIKRVIEIPKAPYVSHPFPFRIERRRPTPEEGFRQSELHLTFLADESDGRVVKQFLDAGLFGAYEWKADGRRYLVLTAQGYRRDIDSLAKMILAFLEQTGGLVGARLKIELAIAHRLFGITTADLPPICDKIIWR